MYAVQKVPVGYQLKKRSEKKRSLLELEEDKEFAFLRLTLMMRIRFRASYFGQIAKNKSLLFVQIETGFLLCETDAEMVPGPFVCLLVGFFSSSVRFWT